MLIDTKVVNLHSKKNIKYVSGRNSNTNEGRVN